MTPAYLGFGSQNFRGAPIVLTNPSAGALATALAAYPGAPASGNAYRVLTAGSATVKSADQRSATWTHAAGEGYAFPIVDVVAAASVVLVFV